MAFPVPYQGLQLSTAFVDLNLSYICILRTILRLERISVVRYRARVVSTVVDVVTSTPPANPPSSVYRVVYIYAAE